MSRNPSLDDAFLDMHLRPKSSTSSSEQPRVDWRENDTTFVFKADVPRLKKEQVTVEIKDGKVLYLRGENNRKRENAKSESTSEVWYLKEIEQLGKFERKFELPEDVNVEKVKAKMEDGVLTVTLPKEVETGVFKTIPISN